MFCVRYVRNQLTGRSLASLSSANRRRLGMDAVRFRRRLNFARRRGPSLVCRRALGNWRLGGCSAGQTRTMRRIRLSLSRAVRNGKGSAPDQHKRA